MSANLSILFALGCTAGFINAMAGGGSILTVPALIFLGLDGAMANGTNRIAVAMQSIFAVIAFKKSKFHDFRQSWKYTLYTLPGAVLGAFLAIQIGDDLFKKILGIIMLGIVTTLFIPITKSRKTVAQGSKSGWLINISLLAIGFYGGFLQIGVGFMIMAALYHIEKLDLIRVNMHKVFLTLFFTLPALAVFILSGNVNWLHGLVLAGGNSLGAWYGTKVSIKGGEKIIRVVITIAVVIMALKLFEVF